MKQDVVQKHCQIQNRSQTALSKQDSVYVYSSDNLLSRYALLNFINKRRVKETCCIRVRRLIQVPGAILSFKWMCAQAINQILTTRQKEQYIRCEVRLFVRTGQQHCFEVEKNGIREVACA